MDSADPLTVLAEYVPDQVDPAEWATMSIGDRLRRLWRPQQLRTLPPETRRMVLALPRWTRYGPGDGPPQTWFDSDGLLRPEFRDDGVHHREYRFFLVSNRLASLARVRLAKSLNRRIWRLVHSLAASLPGILIGLVLLQAFAAIVPQGSLGFVVRLAVLYVCFEVSFRCLYSALWRAAFWIGLKRVTAMLRKRFKAIRSQVPP